MVGDEEHVNGELVLFSDDGEANKTTTLAEMNDGIGPNLRSYSFDEIADVSEKYERQLFYLPTRYNHTQGERLTGGLQCTLKKQQSRASERTWIQALRSGEYSADNQSSLQRLETDPTAVSESLATSPGCLSGSPNFTATV